MGQARLIQENINNDFEQIEVAQVTEVFPTQSTIQWSDSTYANGIWMRCGASDVMAYSRDGAKTWTTKKLPQNLRWSKPAYGNGVWLTCGKGNNDEYSTETNIAVYSTDNGNTWAKITLPKVKRWLDPVFNNGVFIIMGTDFYASNVVLYSTDGKTFFNSSIPSSGLYCIPVYGNGVWFTCEPTALTSGGSYTSNVAAYSKDNGKTWKNITLPRSQSWTEPVFANGIFVLCGKGTDSNLCIYSSDGISWEQSALPTRGSSWNYVCFGNSTWVALGCATGGTGVCAYSTDNAKTWQEGNMPLNTTTSHESYNASGTRNKRKQLEYGNGYFIFSSIEYGYIPLLGYSKDGKNWDTVVSTSLKDCYYMTYGEKQFIASQPYSAKNAITIFNTETDIIKKNISKSHRVYGTYGSTSSGSDGRFINLGFKPSAVLIERYDGARTDGGSWSKYGGLILDGFPIKDNVATICASGFYVKDKLNTTNMIYYYIAFK